MSLPAAPGTEMNAPAHEIRPAAVRPSTVSGRGLTSGPWDRLKRPGRHGRLLLGAAIVGVVIVMALIAPWLAPHDPNRVSLVARLTPPFWAPGGSSKYPLGTDQLGRDLLSRIIFGARISLTVGFLSVLSAGTLGTALGLIAGYYGGGLDSVIMRATDAQMALPFILLALMVVALLGPSLSNIIVVFTITAWYVYARIARASTLSLRGQQYVEAARALGATDARILQLHVLPQLLSPLIVVVSFELARIIISEAALGFFGLGVPPPAPSWGNMLSDGREFMEDAWWIATFPGLTLMITVLGINLLGDALRDLLDPKLRL
jgi:peptide/nickel transport system permease protein